jgi:hypothetical protein
MSAKANSAILALFDQFNAECKKLSANRKEMSELAASYFRYRDLLDQQERIRYRIVKIFGALGKFSPDVSSDFAKLISPKPIDSEDVRRELRVWELFELFLSALDGKATIGEFRSFLFQLDIEATSQAIESAIKAHPELFEESRVNGERVFCLRRFSTGTGKFDALLALQGSGRDIWADEHADEYVNRLREGWE